MERQQLNLTEYQVAVLANRLQQLRNEKSDYSPDLSTETAIRDSCKVLGKFDGQIEQLSDLIEEAHTIVSEEE